MPFNQNRITVQSNAMERDDEREKRDREKQVPSSE